MLLSGSGLKCIASYPANSNASRSRLARHRGLKCGKLQSTPQETVQVDPTRQQQGSGTTRQPDAFYSASLRLRGLIECCGAGEDELLDNMVAEESPYTKLHMQVALAALTTSVSAVVASLAGQDLWGGTNLSVDSLQAAVLGLGLAAPLVVLRWWSWTPQATQEVIPQLADMRLQQLEAVSPWFNNLTLWHTLTMMALEVLPMTVLLFPAAQGCLLASLDLYTRWSTNYQLGDDLPIVSDQPTAQLGCLFFTASIASLSRGLELCVDEAQYKLVSEAMENADRYYRVMSTGVSRRAADAEYAARAFRAVAQSWLQTRREACTAAGSICALDVMVLGGIWYGTHSLIVTVVAALAINSVDYYNFHAILKRRELRAAAAEAKGSSSSSQKKNSGAAGSPRE